MKRIEVTERLVQLTRLGFVNCFLVREDDGFTLVDTTLSGNARAIMEGASEAGAPILRLALTHPHVDHTGSLDAFHEALPYAEVIMGTRELRLTEEERRLDPDEPQANVLGGWPASETHPDRQVGEVD